MRRTRVVAAAFAGSICLAALAPASVAAGRAGAEPVAAEPTASEPTAEVSPHRVRPGGTVTITVTCPQHEEKVRYITAYSQAFEEGEADLQRVSRGGGYGKATYSGKARIASAHHSGGSWRSESYGSDDSSGREDSYGSGASLGPGDSYGTDDPYGSDDSYDGSYNDSYSGGSAHHGKRYGVNGSCPDGRDFTASVIVERKPRGGAHAGQGGSQGATDTAAVAAGGALVSATVGFGVYALRRRRSGA